MSRKIQVTDEQIIEVAKKSPSATWAAKELGIKYGTYKIHAQRLGVFVTNQGAKGSSKPILDDRKISLEKILSGNHPHYQSNKLRKRLIKEGVKEHKCECCNGTEWLGKPIPLELEHMDGNCYNHKIENLKMLCPNCHAQTDTYRGKNKSKPMPK